MLQTAGHPDHSAPSPCTPEPGAGPWGQVAKDLRKRCFLQHIFSFCIFDLVA